MAMTANREAIRELLAAKDRYDPVVVDQVHESAENLLAELEGADKAGVQLAKERQALQAERDQLYDLCLRAWRLLDTTEPNADITSELFNYLAEYRSLGAEGIAAGYARKDET